MLDIQYLERFPHQFTRSNQTEKGSLRFRDFAFLSVKESEHLSRTREVVNGKPNARCAEPQILLNLNIF